MIPAPNCNHINEIDQRITTCHLFESGLLIYLFISSNTLLFTEIVAMTGFPISNLFHVKIFYFFFEFNVFPGIRILDVESEIKS